MFPIYGLHQAAALVQVGEQKVMIHEKGVMNVTEQEFKAKKELRMAMRAKKMSSMSSLGCRDQCEDMLKMTTSRNGQLGELMESAQEMAKELKNTASDKNMEAIADAFHNLLAAVNEQKSMQKKGIRMLQLFLRQAKGKELLCEW